MIETLKTLGIILATGAVAFAITYPLAMLIVPSRKEDI